MIATRPASAERESAPRRIRSIDLAVVFAGFTLAAVVMTLPLWQHPTRRLPSDLMDTLLNTWIIGWDADRLRHALRGLWDAPAFFPYRNVLAFSENLLGLALFVAPVYWLTGNAVLTYNVAFTLSFAFAGVGMYLLATALTGSRRCGLVGAAFYAFCPFRFIEISHVQLIATGWLPIALYALHRYFETDRPRWLGVCGVASWLQVLSNTYVAYFMALPIAFVVGAAVWRDRARRARRVAELAAAGLLTALALAPVAWKYYEVRSEYGQVRRLDEMTMNSADVRSYFIGNPSIGMWRWLRANAPPEPERELFPGILAIVLSAVALGGAGGRSESARSVRAYALIAASAAALSLGPQPRAWGHLLLAHGPYDWLIRIVPGMDGMRVPARFALIFFLGLSVLAACGARTVTGALPARFRNSAIVLCIVLILAESWTVPLPVYSYPSRGRPGDYAVAEWLKGRPAGGVLHEPVRTANHQELNWQYSTLRHLHPIVNGISGYDTPLQILFRDESSVLYDANRPADVVRMLRSLGVRYVVVHVDDYNLTQLNRDEHGAALRLLRESGQVVEERRFLETFAFELQPPIPPPAPEPLVPIAGAEARVSVSHAADRAPFLRDGDRDSRWFTAQDGSGWIAVDFARAADVARVDLRLAERSLTDYPRELQIEAIDPAGVTRTLYRAVPYPEFLIGFVADPRYPRLSIALPANRSTSLTIRDVGTAPGRWWSVHELELWRR